MGKISTAFNEGGQETTLSVLVLVQEQGSGKCGAVTRPVGASQGLVLFTSIMAGADTSVMQGQLAEWKQRNRAGVAFYQLALMAEQIPHARIKYHLAASPAGTAPPEATPPGRPRISFQVLDDETGEPVAGLDVCLKMPDGTVATYTTEPRRQRTSDDLLAGTIDLECMVDAEAYEVLRFD